MNLLNEIFIRKTNIIVIHNEAIVEVLLMIASIFTIFKAIRCMGVCLRVLATIMSS